MRTVVSIALALPAALLIGAPVAAAQPSAPSADQLTAQLQRALNTSLSDDERAAELELSLIHI